MTNHRSKRFLTPLTLTKRLTLNKPLTLTKLLNKLPSLFITTHLVFASVVLVGCTSTTNSGTMGSERKQLLLVSDQEILQLAEQSYRQILNQAYQQGQLDNNPVQLARLTRIAQRLIAQTGIYRPDAINWHWEIHTIDSNKLNAYVMAGGKMIFYTGIIEQLKLNDDEIAAIMGHEMAHALREHHREQLSRELAVQSGIGLAANFFGLTNTQATLANIASEFGLNLPHSRTQEREADRLGLELMARAGYNPNAAISLWQKMQAIDGDFVSLEFLSTHPNSGNRINELNQMIPAVMPLYHNVSH